MLSYLGWIDCTDTYGVYRKRVKPFVNFKYLKRRVSNYERKLNRQKERDSKCGTGTRTGKAPNPQP